MNMDVSLNEPAAREFRIMVVVENEIIRNGLSVMLRSLSAVAHVTTAEPPLVSSSARSILPDDTDCDVLILGFDDLVAENVERTAREAWDRGMKVLLLLDRDQDDALDVVTGLPSDGFLVQDGLTAGDLDGALRKVARGEPPMPAALVNRLLVRAREGVVQPRPPRPNLTPRERQVLQLLVEGLSNKQIARELHISQHGVKRIVSNVLAKLNCANRTLAVAVALTDRILADE